LTLEVWEVVELGCNEIKNRISITNMAPYCKDWSVLVVLYDIIKMKLKTILTLPNIHINSYKERVEFRCSVILEVWGSGGV